MGGKTSRKAAREREIQCCVSEPCVRERERERVCTGHPYFYRTNGGVFTQFYFSLHLLLFLPSSSEQKPRSDY